MTCFRQFDTSDACSCSLGKKNQTIAVFKYEIWSIFSDRKPAHHYITFMSIFTTLSTLLLPVTFLLLLRFHMRIHWRSPSNIHPPAISCLPTACNVMSQSPEGSYTMVIPQQHRNCSFSIIYPVAIDISEFSLGHYNNFPKVNHSLLLP